MSADMSAYLWPLERLGEGLEALARRSGLKPIDNERMPMSESVQSGGPAERARWMRWATERLGLEAESLEVTASTVIEVLTGAGPAVLHIATSTGPHALLVLDSRRGRARLLCPDHKVRRGRLQDLRDAICAPHERPYSADISQILEFARVPARRRQAVTSALAQDRLGDTPVARAWMLRVPPSASFWRQLREARVPHRLGGMLALFAFMYVLEIASWAVIGEAALNGRLDLGWLVAWALLVLSLVPLSLLGGWIDARLALEVSQILKSRLLVGALQLEVDTVRRQGAGHLLGQVMESNAFEALALNFGLGSLVALVELACAAWVLGHGAAPALHLILIALWLAVAVAMSRGYFRRLHHWTALRLRMTHSLVERMVGHRTRLAQESPERRDRGEDAEMHAYFQASASLDRTATPMLAGVPGGWTILAVLALAPAFVAGSATPAGLAISLGGILLAGRAFSGMANGLGSAAGAAVAWRQIQPLFDAASRPAATTPFVSATQMQPRAAGSNSDGALIDADGLTYRYQAEGDAVLRGATLSIRHGDRLLIEGASGGGKSTLASLLVGLRRPDSGVLLMNGLDRFTLGDNWHEFATEAPQFHENHILTGTLGFNLLMGRNWPASEEDLQEAGQLCEELGLGDLLRHMPSRLMQTVGETGWQLSHGERSRLFLARALLQKAPLTVLDESFAALDPESLERCLQTVLRRSGALAVIAHP